MYTGPGISLSPSFNSYSNYNIAEIAARVVEEFRADNTSEEFYDEFCIENKENSSTQKVEVDEEAANSGSLEIEDKNDDDFDFAFVAKETEFSSPISADEIFYNGQIRPVFPIYKRGILLGNINIENENKNTENLGSTRAPKIRVPLRKLFIEERETTSSSSSSETDELDNLPPGTYCVWKPKAAEAARQCKKSSSAGSSKRWKFRDLLHRSNSDGRKDGFVFLNPSNRERERENDKTEKEEETPAVAASARKGDERRRDVVRFFAIVNGLSRNLHPFN
ncbi:Protein of unknown function (DUF1645) [Abeliophyllum distichum]|uniref:Uncharacterized protein n=1 Tax=Abeliophyllum distichum TaxID=126358 RepID=A0ABD1VQ98_9LAMI